MQGHPLKPLPAHAELHVHLDGSMRPATLLSLAQGTNLSWKEWSAEALEQAVSPPLHPPSLPAYLRAFDLTCSAMQTADAIERIAYELVLDAASDGTTHLEARYCPSLLIEGGLTRREVVAATWRGLKRGEDETGCTARQILCGLRSFDPADSLACARAAVEGIAEGVVGFDLAGNEAACLAMDHVSAFATAHEAGLGITCHAGEACGPESIRDALHLPGIQRIGHGTALREDAGLIREIAERGISIEVCLTSNLQTGAVERLEHHPLLSLLQHNVRVALCTDNRLVSSTTLPHEYALAASVFRLSEGDLERLAHSSLQAAFTRAR